MTYLWSVKSSPAGSTTSDNSFNDKTLKSPTFLPDLPGEYKIALVVTDDLAVSDPVFMNVTANAGITPPTVEAGDKQTIELPSECSPDGNGGTICSTCTGVFTVEALGMDPENDDLTYHWTSENTRVVIDTPDARKTTISFPPIKPHHQNDVGTIWTRMTVSVSDCGNTTTDVVEIVSRCHGGLPSN